MSSVPEYLICIECETPCYNFDVEKGKIVEILCDICGNDDLDQFATVEEMEAMGAG